MERGGRLARNILWQVLARLGAQGLAVLLSALLARRLGSAGFGEYAFLSAAIFLGNALTTFGTDMLLIREIAGLGRLERLPAALALQLALSAGFILLTWMSAPQLPNQSADAVQGLRLYSLALIPLAFFSVFTTALRGKQRMDGLMLLNLASAGLQVAAVAVFFRSGGGIQALAGLLLGSQLAAAAVGAGLCAWQIPGFWRDWRFSWRETIALARACARMGGLSLVGIVYQKASVFLLSSLGGAALTGWYSAAARSVEAAKLFHLASFTALYPAMAEESGSRLPGGERRPPWQGAFRLSWQALLAGAALAALGLSLLAEPLVRLLFGPGFEPAVPALRLLAWSLVPFCANTFFSISWLAAHGEKQVLRVQSLGLAALLAGSVWAIPRLGLAGACLAGLLAETLQSAAYLFLAARAQGAWLGLGRFARWVKGGGEDGVPAVSRKIR